MLKKLSEIELDKEEIRKLKEEKSLSYRHLARLVGTTENKLKYALSQYSAGIKNDLYVNLMEVLTDGQDYECQSLLSSTSQVSSAILKQTSKLLDCINRSIEDGDISSDEILLIKSTIQTVEKEVAQKFAELKKKIQGVKC